MSRRFYITTRLSDLTDCTASVDGAEAHHLAHVMRAKPGDTVTLFDGRGWEAEAEIEVVGRREISLRVGRACELSRELPYVLELAVALPRGDRQEWLVEKAVELGVTRLVPIESERSVARPNEKTLEKLRRAVIEASKQCGRNRLMEIAEVTSLADYLPSVTGGRWFAHVMPERSGESLATRSGASASSQQADAATHIAIGPEGGFTDDEAQQATATGWRLVSLGPRILRTETAALALASCFAVPSTIEQM